MIVTASELSPPLLPKQQEFHRHLRALAQIAVGMITYPSPRVEGWESRVQKRTKKFSSGKVAHGMCNKM